ncbi:MAG: cytidine deaminase [Treponema sp.]|jgi:cytidine deaminase|nr:cytidine deaminase [Treponema sp.]
MENYGNDPEPSLIRSCEETRVESNTFALDSQMQALFNEALKAAAFAYAPYSQFHVGAALLAADGTVYTGCNVENRSFGLTICAERSAVVQAVSKGQRSFVALAIAAPDSETPVGPCGACRQVLSEFMTSDALVRFGGSGPEQVNTTIGALYPYDSLHELAASLRQ